MASPPARTSAARFIRDQTNDSSSFALMSLTSFSPSFCMLMMGIPSTVSVVMVSVKGPVAAKIGCAVPVRVRWKSIWSFAVMIFGMSVRLAMRLWKPSIKTRSRFSFSSSSSILLRSFSSRLVFLIMSISCGEMATTTLLPAAA